jgi:hypothetical protein
MAAIDVVDRDAEAKGRDSDPKASEAEAQAEAAQLRYPSPGILLVSGTAATAFPGGTVCQRDDLPACSPALDRVCYRRAEHSVESVKTP